MSGHITSRCPNKRTIIMKHCEIKSKSNKFNVHEMSPLDDCSDVEIVYLVEGEALVIRHVINAQVKKNDVDH